MWQWQTERIHCRELSHSEYMMQYEFRRKGNDVFDSGIPIGRKNSLLIMPWPGWSRQTCRKKSLLVAFSASAEHSWCGGAKLKFWRFTILWAESRENVTLGHSMSHLSAKWTSPICMDEKDRFVFDSNNLINERNYADWGLTTENFL